MQIFVCIILRYISKGSYEFRFRFRFRFIALNVAINIVFIYYDPTYEK